MKCQECDEPATHHVTEIVGGNPVEFHVCDRHLQDWEAIKKAPKASGPEKEFVATMIACELGKALCDQETRNKLAAYLLPALCLALLDPKPEVRVVAAFQLMGFGRNAQSAVGALRDALQDSDERVRNAARIALEYGQSNDEVVASVPDHMAREKMLRELSDWGNVLEDCSGYLFEIDQENE